jgi:mycofactocin system creatininase family protein
MAWIDVGSPIVVVPVGSCEQHGPHLPLHTDTVIATALARELAARRDDCVVAPPLTITASGEHQGFAGTLSIGNAAMADLVIELVRSADWSQGVVFVNGHGGNATAMARAADTLARESRRLLVWWPSVLGGDPHAGHVETSLMLALAPDEVDRDRAVVGPVPAMADLVRSGVQPLSASGVLGDPTTASADEGRRLFAELAAQLVGAVASWVDQ